ncbi:hypothetical protein HDIA_4113 [Hartmannibacter diazotrophicus]|uniref:Uncharacterized protein n=1 Tax=Hartmannibacter diazotrophicus TaxID=1482074 RepID=A0A2C9DBF5_9HYPH|nr:hypothetical protein [Hartmannibacter diazotrophicus]SON57654.1 hypothetical protein HDIA_4113 [Hartmannibacter diazotrophicus]
MLRVGKTNLVYLVVLALFLVLAVREAVQSIRFSDVVFVGKRGVSHFRSEVLMRQRDSAVLDEGVCRSEIVSADVLGALENVNRQDIKANYDGWAEATTQADVSLRHALTCMPLRGELWAWMALVKRQAAENASELFSYLNMSYWTAPYELAAIRLRLEAEQSFSDETLNSFGNLQEKDLLSGLTFLPDFEAKTFAEEMQPLVRRNAEDLLPLIPAERRPLVEAQAGGQG